MVTVDGRAEDNVVAEIMKSTKSAKMKSKAINGAVSEMAFEVTLKNDSTGFMNKLSAASGVQSVSIVKAANEYI